MRFKQHHLIGLVTLALLGAVLVLLDPIAAEDPPLEPSVTDVQQEPEVPRYEVAGQILTRVRDDGRLEFCFLPELGEVVCPDSRILNLETARRDRWIRSSEIAWELPLNPGKIILPPAPEPTVRVEEDCTPDFERMMAATWKVATTRARGSAFYIGGGRFVTAHHVIDDVPPFVALTHNDRTVVAEVLGSNADHDVALLEAFDPHLLRDIPQLAFRSPLKSDIGDPVFLVGYPSAGALTASTGVLTRVWEDEILTNSSSFGGNSGGPMFDACGNVIGILWAGSSARNFSHSGDSLRLVLDGLSRRSARLPEQPPGIDIPEGTVIWHYADEPPADVDCVGVDGAWWVGVAGASSYGIDWGTQRVGSCGHGLVTVVALEDLPASISPSETETESDLFYEEGPCPGEPGSISQAVETVLHESTEEFGTVRYGALRQLEWCKQQPTYELHVDFAKPLNHRLFSADLIGAGGQVLNGSRLYPYHSYYSREGFIIGMVQAWQAPEGFEPVAFRVTINRQSWRVEIQRPDMQTADDTDALRVLQQGGRIAIWVERGSDELNVCFELPDEELVCPSESGRPELETNEWQAGARLSWTVPVEWEGLSVQTGCQLTSDLGELAWQMSGLGGDGSAVYVGRNQFITADRLFGDTTPWGVVSQGARALPVARVASDLRNGLALVEVIGEIDADHGRPIDVRFAASTEDADQSTPVLVAYPWGDADRFAMTRLQVSRVTERLLEHDGWGWDRAGAPVVDPCTRQVIGVTTGRDEALRAETAMLALRNMRFRQVPVQPPAQGPELNGSIALLSRPVYLSTEQPDFGGWICNVRPSLRYQVLYAVYLVSDASPDLAGVVDGQNEYLSRCGWSGKIFIVEYRSDQPPSMVCAEPSLPSSPESTIDLALSAPPGVELVLATHFHRAPCPGLPEASDWSSTHLVRLRFAGVADLHDLDVQLEDASGRKYESTRWGGDVDPDVGAWRFDLGGTEPVRLIVSVFGESEEPPRAESEEDKDANEPMCVEDHGPRGDGLITATLHQTRTAFGSVRYVRLGAPVRCPWFHTHSLFVTFSEPVSDFTRLQASLIAKDASVLGGHWSGASYRGQGNDEYTSYHQHFVVPDDFEPIAAEIAVGAQRWIVVFD